jgi:hypothetical protein
VYSCSCFLLLVFLSLDKQLLEVPKLGKDCQDSNSLKSPMRNRKLVRVRVAGTVEDHVKPETKAISPRAIPSLMNGKFLSEPVREPRSALEEIDLKLRADAHSRENMSDRAPVPPVLQSSTKYSSEKFVLPAMNDSFMSDIGDDVKNSAFKSIWYNDFGTMYNHHDDAIDISRVDSNQNNTVMDY